MAGTVGRSMRTTDGFAELQEHFPENKHIFA